MVNGTNFTKMFYKIKTQNDAGASHGAQTASKLESCTGANFCTPNRTGSFFCARARTGPDQSTPEPEPGPDRYTRTRTGPGRYL
jgi:hypothetical protein